MITAGSCCPFLRLNHSGMELKDRETVGNTGGKNTLHIWINIFIFRRCNVKCIQIILNLLSKSDFGFKVPLSSLYSHFLRKANLFLEHLSVFYNR